MTDSDPSRSTAAAVKTFSLFKQTFRLPIVLWQSLFFIGPLCFMVAMSFFIVRNYRMQEDFVVKNGMMSMKMAQRRTESVTLKASV